MESISQRDEWQHYQQVLEYLSSLSYRSGELKCYLTDITRGVSSLLHLDWSVVTLCQEGFERVLASSVDMGEGEHVYSLHGSLTGTVIAMGRSLAVEDAKTCPEYGEPPAGYCSYLGVPMRTPQGEVIGTICSFNHQPRRFLDLEVQTVELFAERAATAIDNYHLYQQQLQFNERLEHEVALRTAELCEAQAKLVEQERLAAIGEFAAMIVHEIRNPLTTVMMGLKSFKRISLPESAQERLQLAADEADRLERLLGEILLYAKPQILRFESVELNSLVNSAIAALQETPVAQICCIKVIPADSAVSLFGDRDKLKQVLINVIRNALEAIAPGETVTCAVQSDGEWASIQVHNGGEPIAPEVMEKLTRPFFSTKPGGTGLGLAIVKRIIDAHGGTFTIASTAEAGTTVSIYLPWRK
jgi:signal transduction histidine kinase